MSKVQDQNTTKIISKDFYKTNDKMKTPKFPRPHRNITDPDLLCGIIFVDKGFTAKILFYLLYVSINFTNI